MKEMDINLSSSQLLCKHIQDVYHNIFLAINNYLTTNRLESERNFTKKCFNDIMTKGIHLLNYMMVQVKISNILVFLRLFSYFLYNFKA
jgi:hypothetical protein